jgi:hypothetical protein
MILATLLISAAIAATPPDFEVDYDRFTDTTNIFSSDALPSHKGRTFFILAAVHRRDSYSPGSPVAYRIQVWAYRQDWDYLRCHNLAILADGKPVLLPRTDFESDIISGNSVAEYISVNASREAIAAIAAARKVEIQVCRDEWVLPASASKKAGAIIAATPAPSGQTAPPQPL